MEKSILTSTKKVLGIVPDNTEFDLDVITHINAAFSLLNQLGVGPEESFSIESASPKWDDFECPEDQLHLVKQYLYLKTSISFDPPQTSSLMEARKGLISEFEWRLNSMREVALAKESS